MKITMIAVQAMLIFTATMVLGSDIGSLKPPREFSKLPTDIQKGICMKLGQCLVREDVYCGLVQILPEYIVTNAWPALPYSEKDFRFMKNLGYRPTSLSQIFVNDSNLQSAIDKGTPVYFQLRNPPYKQVLADQRLEGIRMMYSPPVISFSRKCIFAFFERLKTHEWNPEDVFVREELCKLDMRDWPASCRSLWRTSAYGIMPGCAFVVNRRHSIPPPTVQFSKGMKKIIDSFYQSARLDENLHPLIELSDREATEIVYLAALCRGKVKSLDEFNAVFVPKGETFLVKLTAAECETEIGRMLYTLAKKRGFIQPRDAHRPRS